MKNKSLRFMSISAMLIAIIAVMTFIPNVGYIVIIPASLSFTTLHIIVLIAAMVFGYKEGFIAGLAFGVLCLIKAVALPTSATDPAFINPLVSVLPRAIFGFVAGLLFDLTKKIPNKKLLLFLDFSIILFSTLLHSFITLSMYYVCQMNSLSTGYGQILLSIMTLNCVIEVVGALILTPTISLALFKAYPDTNRYFNKGKINMKKDHFYDELTANYKGIILEKLNELCSIDSTFDADSVDEKNPFGKGVSKALEYVENLAKEDGFVVNNYNNMVVEILAGEGKKNLTIMAHADVVPAGTGWDINPFSSVLKNGVLYGRGVADDKGPLLAAYYGLKALRDNNLLGDYQVRFLIGGNEESGSRGMKYYFEELKKPQPNLGFTPDSSFPLNFAEKAIMDFEVNLNFEFPQVKSMKGGVASNAVIERFEVEMEDDLLFIDYLKEKNINFIKEDNKVIFLGKAAHGAVPEMGINAAMIGIKSLAEFYHHNELTIIKDKYSNLNGLGVNAFSQSPDMGLNSLNVGLVSYKNNSFSMVVNFRFVNTANKDELINNIKEASKPFDIVIHGVSPLLYFPKDSVLVSTLMKVYQEETGDLESQPISSGGGTYAKEAENVVAFGMEFPGWDPKMHSPGEQLKEDDLYKGMSIYAHAIRELGKKLNEN